MLAHTHYWIILMHFFAHARSIFTNRPVACKALGIHYLLIERDVTFGVLGGPQKCIGMYGKIAMPTFKLRATPQLYSICYLSESSVKLETPANTRNFESGELIVAFVQGIFLVGM